LDYLPDDNYPYPVTPRLVKISEKSYLVASDLQVDHDSHYCRNVDVKTGRCGIYENRPFSCDFELIRFLVPKSVKAPIVLTQKLYGRGWAMTRVDNKMGAKCEMTKPTPETAKEVARKLRDLKRWADHFEIETCLPEIIEYVDRGPTIMPLLIPV
jgi:Fe-S-cluster containining protein